MNRETLIKDMAQRFSLTEHEINQGLQEIYTKNKQKCCHLLVQEALDEPTRVEYNACCDFFKYLMIGEP